MISMYDFEPYGKNCMRSALEKQLMNILLVSLCLNFQFYLYAPILNININLDECAFIVVADVIRFAIPILRSSAQCPTVSTLCIVKLDDIQRIANSGFLSEPPCFQCFLKGSIVENIVCYHHPLYAITIINHCLLSTF